jgi:hypothetical protein
VVAMQKKKTCGGDAKEKAVWWRCKRKSRVVAMPKKKPCGGDAKEKAVWWRCKRGKVVKYWMAPQVINCFRLHKISKSLGQGDSMISAMLTMTILKRWKQLMQLTVVADGYS